jgi:CBS domain-containing protein
MLCPSCGYQVIDGDEFCERCRCSLIDVEEPAARSDLERNIAHDTIRFLSPKSPLTTSPETPVGEVVQLLADRDVGSIVVVQERQIVGIFSERDVLLKLNASARKLRSHPVSEFMTRNVESLDIDDHIALALHKMDLGGYRHLPVTEDDELVGIISIRDIMRYMTETILTSG